MRLTTLLTTSLFCSAALIAAPQIAPKQAYQAHDFSHLLGMPGFSDTALNNHFKLYQGYVNNTNLLITILNQLTQEEKQRTPQFQELKRRFGWEFDGMRLHELYFDNLGGKGILDPTTPLAQQILKDFGSFDTWKTDFVETGMLRGIGWSVLYLDPTQGRLINTWIGEHDMGNLAGGTPILVMDVWEHAFMPDYGLDRAAYINAFFNNINWDVVSKRLHNFAQKTPQ
jgi:Fe-Mn family superoxide dismutase